MPARNDTAKLRDKLDEQSNGGDVATLSPADQVRHLLERMKPQIARALPKGFDPERLTRIALTTIRLNPQLLTASQESLVAAVMLSAQLGLEPGPLGHCYLVPFRNRKTGQTEVTFIVGYKGLIDLARRSGQIQSIEARTVYANDDFEYEFGLNPVLRHKPALGDRGDAVLWYGVVHYKDGGHYFEVLPKSEIEKHRSRSKASDNGPWLTDYEAMARKTVIRAMAPYLPLTVEAARAVAADDSAPVDIVEDMADAIDVSIVADDQVTAETEPVEVCPVCGAAEGTDHDPQVHAEHAAAETAE